MWKWVIGGVVAFAALMLGSKAFASTGDGRRSGDITPPPPPPPPVGSNPSVSKTDLLRQIHSGDNCFDAIANKVIDDYYAGRIDHAKYSVNDVVNEIAKIYSNTCGKIKDQQRQGMATAGLILGAFTGGVKYLRS